MSEHRTPEDVIRHYRDEIDEDQRIRRGLGQLELLRTREIVRRCGVRTSEASGSAHSYKCVVPKGRELRIHMYA